MSKQTEALKLALKKAFDLGQRYWQQADSDFTSQWRKADVTLASFNQLVEDTIREALAEQPAQQQKEGFASPGGGYVPAIPRPMPLDWKLVPRKATPEMLKAMDECAQEGYDERLYAGMASSVYMAAWDASPVMGTLPEQPAQQQEPAAWRTFDGEGGYDYRTYDMNENYAKEWDKQNLKHKGWVEPLYTSPQPNKPWAGLSTDEIYGMYNEPRSDAEMVEFARAIEAKLREKNT